MIRYQLRLVRPDESTEIPVALLTGLLGALMDGNLRALRLRIEGFSTRRGAVPHWLREAASFSLVGVRSGSVVLDFEAPPLRQMLPFFALGLLDAGAADRPCVALFAESLAAALSAREEDVLYDADLLATFESLSGIFAMGVERIELMLDPGTKDAQAVVRAEDIGTIARLRRRFVEHQKETVVVTGHLIKIDLDKRAFTLRPDAGAPLNGLVDDLLVDQLAPFLGQRVTISGRAITGTGGVIRRFSADAVQPAQEADAPVGVDSGQKALLSCVQVSGLRSIRQLSRLELGAINVLIGPNGAGKSNLISFFRLLRAMASPGDALATYVARSGGASSLLYDGPAVTPEMSASLTFTGETGAIDYSFRLVHGAPDALVFAEEKYRFSPVDTSGTETPWVLLGAGHRESSLHRLQDLTARRILSLLRRPVVYQFHDTSGTARIRQRSSVGDSVFLRSDGGNLAPFLLRLRESQPESYSRIVDTLRQIAPFFDDFFLEPQQGSVMLQWRERGTDMVFQPHQSSDGMLRVMALVTLLLQPRDLLPALLIADEPELGLHPYAVNVVAGLFRSASTHAQVMLATQSIAFLDCFAPEEVVVVERPDRDSRFGRLDGAALQDWLEDYSLGELWEKNVIGGRPR